MRAIIFDMDGVLLDSEPLHFEATCELLAEHGVSYAPAGDENFYGCTDRDVFAALKARYGLVAAERELAEDWIARVVALLPARALPLAGVPGVLLQLRESGIRLALASSSAPAIIETTLATLRVSEAFEVTVSGHDVANGKPSPDIFVEAACRLGLDAGECLVVEDSMNGLRAALAAGMRCVVVPCASTAHQDFTGAAGRLENLEQLPGWIRVFGA
jgi:HAD superfamily hydrolase (TIGR01509 family)